MKSLWAWLTYSYQSTHPWKAVPLKLKRLIVQINVSSPGPQNKHCTVTVRGRAETLLRNWLSGSQAKPEAATCTTHWDVWQGMVTGNLLLSFLLSQKAILCERHMVGETAAAADLQQLWLLTFQGEVDKALFLHAEQHRHLCEFRLLLFHQQQQHPGEDASQGLCWGWWGTQAPCPGQRRSHGPWPAVWPPLCCPGHRQQCWEEAA